MNKFQFALVLTFGLINCIAVAVQAQEKSEKKPVLIIYDADNKPATLDKLNLDLEKYALSHVLTVRQYGTDSNVYKVEKKPRKMFLQDSIRNDNRLTELKALEGTLAEDFTLTSLNGKEFKLSRLKGKIVVLNFWFTRCSPCIDEIADLNRLATMYNKSKVIFLAITFDKAEAIQVFQKEHEFKFHLLPDAKIVTDDYGIKLYPRTMVIDKTGTIRLAINTDENILNKVKKAIDSI